MKKLVNTTTPDVITIEDIINHSDIQAFYKRNPYIVYRRKSVDPKANQFAFLRKIANEGKGWGFVSLEGGEDYSICFNSYTFKESIIEASKARTLYFFASLEEFIANKRFIQND